MESEDTVLKSAAMTESVEDEIQGDTDSLMIAKRSSNLAAVANPPKKVAAEATVEPNKIDDQESASELKKSENASAEAKNFQDDEEGKAELNSKTEEITNAIKADNDAPEEEKHQLLNT